MGASIEISDPRRALRMFLVGGAAALILLLAIGALVAVPLLNRADRALDALEGSLPIIEEQMAPDVAALESYLDGMPRDLDATHQEVTKVRERLRSVNEEVAALEPPLTSVDQEMTQLRKDIQPIALLTGVLDAVRVLPDMLSALQATRDEVSAVESSIDETNANLEELLDRFDRMLVLLEEIEQHVENIDRKTGPIVPPTGPDNADG